MDVRDIVHEILEFFYILRIIIIVFENIINNFNFSLIGIFVYILAISKQKILDFYKF